MGVELLGVAKGAAVGRVDLTDADVAELLMDGRAQIDVAFANKGGVAEDGAKMCDDFGADFECVEADGRADGGDSVNADLIPTFSRRTGRRGRGVHRLQRGGND